MMYGMGYKGPFSSSSSNLSPLAPPFTVGAYSIPKKNSLGHFVEHPYFDESHHYLGFEPSPFDNWPPLQPDTSLPNPFNDPNPRINAIGGMSPPYEGTYGLPTPTLNYYSPQSITRPYFPEYPSMTVHDNSSSVVFNEPQSQSGKMAPLSPGGNLWNGMSGEEQWRRKDKNEAGSSNYNSSLNQGTPVVDGLSKCEDSSAVWLAKCVDSMARKCHIGSKSIDLLDTKLSSEKEEKAKVTPFNLSRTSVSDPTSLFQEMPYHPVTSSESVLKSWSHLNPNTASYERCVSDLDSIAANPTRCYPSSIYSSLAHVYDSPCNSSTFEKTFLSENMNHFEKPWDAYDNKEASSSRTQVHTEGKEGCGDTSRTNNGFDVNNQFSMDSITKKDFTSYRNSITDEPFNHLYNPKFKSQLTDVNLPDAFTLVHTAASGASDSVESSSETLDQFNSVLDSPCWKGAPTSHHSPCGITEAGRFNSLNLQGPQILPFDANLVYSENGSAEDGLSYFPKRSSPDVSLSTEKYELKDVVKAGSDHSEMRNENVIQCFFPSNLKNCSETKSSQMMKLNQNEDKDPGIDVKDAALDDSSHVTFGDGERISRLPSSGDSVRVELGEPLVGVSDTLGGCQLPRIGLPVVVNAMHNLSELLLSYSEDVNALKEQDHVVLWHVLNNLDAYVSKVGLVRPIPESDLSQSGTFSFRKLTVPNESQITNAEANDVQNQCDFNASEPKMHSTLSSKKEEKFKQFISSSDDSDFEQDNDDMIQAIKKALMENFHEEDEHPQTSLFKNLWLESEAALCSMACKTRFARMKMKMEKCNDQHQTKDVVGTPINADKPSGSKISVDLNRDDMVASKTNGSMTSSISTHDTSQSSNTSCAEDVEASVMDRYRILKCRVDNSISINKEEKLPDPVDEAKVALCSMEDKAQAAHLKFEMERCNQNHVEDVVGMPINVDHQLQSSKVSFVLDGDDIAASKAKGTMTPNISILDTNQSSNVSVAEDVKSSVMDRFRILQSRIDNMISINKEGQLPNPCDIGAYPGSESVQNFGIKPQLPDLVDMGSAERRVKWPFIRMMRTEDEADLDRDLSEKQDSVKDFSTFVSDDEPETQFYDMDRFGTWVPTSGYDSPSSDWEHVLKEELAWPN